MLFLLFTALISFNLDNAMYACLPPIGRAEQQASLANLDTDRRQGGSAPARLHCDVLPGLSDRQLSQARRVTAEANRTETATQ
ncbi:MULTISPECIES: hypothetical protein [Sphingomonas]|uniref:hypothetical protein n=1 Tax=Sphingomonas TaxID=13687 RepID=UPI001143EFB2|nr:MULTISPECIES: hypothetical protein [Sphingomonas]